MGNYIATCLFYRKRIFLYNCSQQSTIVHQWGEGTWLLPYSPSPKCLLYLSVD